MIMPCMNSTSADERGGNVPFVESGSVLVGLPGAPRCTATGVAGADWCAGVREENRAGGALTASSMAQSSNDCLGEGGFDLWRKRGSCHFDGQLFDRREFSVASTRSCGSFNHRIYITLGGPSEPVFCINGSPVFGRLNTEEFQD